MLLKPLNTIMNHIRTIASGDLTQPLHLSGRNEMGQLAAGLHEMQQSLIGTVSAVRGSTDAIYTGAGEIAAGSNDLGPDRAAGRFAGRDGCQHGAVDRHGETELRQCTTSDAAGEERL